MVYSALVSFLFFVPILLVSAISIDTNRPDASATTLGERTTTVHKRAPSPYPYGNPYPGEWQYENWDPNDDDQRARAEKIHAAFAQWGDMASAALTEASNANSASLSRWAGTLTASDFQKMFAAMWNAQTNSPGDAVAQMVCDQTNFAPTMARTTVVAYTDPESGRFYVTQYGQDRRLNSDIQQSDLDNYASANMRSLPMTFIHELTHFNAINDAIGDTTNDEASGSYACFMLDDDEKTSNAQNYAWFAGEAYWSRQFNMQFSDPTPDTRIKRAVPATSDQRTVGEDQEPQGSFDESPTFSYTPACYGGGSNPFTQGDGASAISTFCSNADFNNFAIVPKVSYGNGTTSGGETKTLDLKDYAKVNNGNTILWMDIAFAESSCIGVAAFNETDCNLQLNAILNGCDTGGDYPKYGGWIESSGESCVTYRLIPQSLTGPDPMYVQGNDGEMGAWTCEDTPTTPDTSNLAGTCTCYYQWQASVTDLFVKPTTSGGCADIAEGTPPKND